MNQDPTSPVKTLYKPCPFRVLREGETRYSGGAVMPTDRLYTGQIAEPILGLYFYNARWYDSSLSRFAQADTIVPLSSQGVQAWDRYAGMNNNPIKYTDPSGHMVACASETGNGCAGFGPSRIINAGYDPEKTAEYLRSFLESRPDYQVEKDPLIYGQNEEFLVRTAQFQVEAEKRPSYFEQLQVALEKPQYEQILANQYTPVVFGAISVLSTDVQYLCLAIPHPGRPITITISYLVGRGAGIVSLVSTGYQYQHNLYGTTKADAEIAATTLLVSSIPKPDMSGMTHLGFLYTFLRTFGAIPSP